MRRNRRMPAHHGYLPSACSAWWNGRCHDMLVGGPSALPMASGPLPNDCSSGCSAGKGNFCFWPRAHVDTNGFRAPVHPLWEPRSTVI